MKAIFGHDASVNEERTSDSTQFAFNPLAISLSHHAIRGVDMTMIDVVDRYFVAAEAADVDELRRIYAPDATIWHNDGAGDLTVDEHLHNLAMLFGAMPSATFEVKRRSEVEGGVFQTHTFHGVLPDGTPVAVDAALFVGVADNRVTRIEEYFDAGAVAAVFAAVE
ncbi:ketosteroid isomerase [Williamsia muralis]|uniref:Ketosteroid isomerase n=2 Tax=Williamsia marianensis TaxID=85044 RepID=A0A2G3PN22_WILMA|nr:ketosteroid isomerase [Williamsia marianensis]